MFDHAADPSTVPSLNDGDMFESIAGRKLRTSRRFLNVDATKLHHAQRKAFEEMPSLVDVCQSLISTVQAEHRHDDEIQLRDLHVDDVGALTSARGDIVPGSASIGMLEQAWSGLVARAPRNVPARLRSNVNSWLRRSNGTAVARTMEIDGARDAFAIVSPSYQAHDADQVAQEVARAMPAECRGNVKYCSDGGRFEIDCVLARPIDVDGDVHRVIAKISSADNGLMSQRISFVAWRLKCLNGLAIMDKATLTRVWHKGDPARLRDQFAAGLAMARVAMDAFTAHWTRARRVGFVDAHTGADLTGPEALRRLVGTGAIEIAGTKASDLLARLQTAWAVEPGDRVADVINAVTRTAHTTPWRAAWTTEDLESLGGRLLFGGNHALPALSRKQSEALAA